MKLTFEFDKNLLPGSFVGDRGGLHNLLAFLHENLYCRQLEKHGDTIVNAEYLKAFYDKQKGEGSGQIMIDAIEKHDQDNINLGKLLLDNLKVEL